MASTRARAIEAAGTTVLALSLAVLPPSARAIPPLGNPRATPPGEVTATVQTPSPRAAAAPSPRAAGDAEDAAGDGTAEGDRTAGSPLADCPARAPIRLDPETCVDQAAIDRINDGWQATVDPVTGETRWTPPPDYDPAAGRWGSDDPARQTCDPNIDVKLKQAALAGSQLTRAISDQQMSYPETDPIAAVNNPQKDGYGGVCTIDIFVFDLRRRLGTTDDQIKALIDALSHLSVDGLFGAACKVVNTILGDLQNQLLQDLQGSSPLTAFQQFVNALRVGYIAPLQSFLGHGLPVRPTAVTLPGVATARPLQVAYVPGKGYLYLAHFGSGNLLILHLSPTPLAPEDAVPAR